MEPVISQGPTAKLWCDYETYLNLQFGNSLWFYSYGFPGIVRYSRNAPFKLYIAGALLMNSIIDGFNMFPASFRRLTHIVCDKWWKLDTVCSGDDIIEQTNTEDTVVTYEWCLMSKCGSESIFCTFYASSQRHVAYFVVQFRRADLMVTLLVFSLWWYQWM